MKRWKLMGLFPILCMAAVLVSGCFQQTTLQALFTVSENEQIAPFTATFDGTLTYSASAAIVSYDWDFGDGQSKSGAVVDHVYEENGTYNVTLTVVDEQGHTSVTSTEVVAINPPPVADFQYSPKSVYKEDIIISASEWVTFDAGASTDDGQILSYDWYFGRDEAGNALTIEGKKVACRYRLAGTYSIVLTVTDNDGGTATCVKIVTVAGSAPCPSDNVEEWLWLKIVE